VVNLYVKIFGLSAGGEGSSPFRPAEYVRGWLTWLALSYFAIMKYEGIVIRSPSGAYSLLLQVAIGCYRNRCSFYSTYKERKFRIKTTKEITEDIIEAGRYRRVDKISLDDGGALIILLRGLVEILLLISKHVWGVKGIGLHGNAKIILRKTTEELNKLLQQAISKYYGPSVRAGIMVSVQGAG
jgi:radical SAM superfamily enzyme YgiQ (UPF0313 family)